MTHWLSDLFKLDHHRFLRLATRLVGNRDDGEEVMQNTYLRLVSRGQSAAAVRLPAISHPRAYALTTLRRAAIDLTIRRSEEAQYRSDLEDPEQLSTGTQTEDQLIARQQVARMAVFLNELPPDCRRAFLLNKVAGWSHREIAADLDVSVSMVEKHLIRALRHCRALMREEMK